MKEGGGFRDVEAAWPVTVWGGVKGRTAGTDDRGKGRRTRRRQRYHTVFLKFTRVCDEEHAFRLIHVFDDFISPLTFGSRGGEGSGDG